MTGPTSNFWTGFGWCLIWLGFGGCVYMTNLDDDSISPEVAKIKAEAKVKVAEQEAEEKMSPAQLAAKYHGTLDDTADTKPERVHSLEIKIGDD